MALHQVVGSGPPTFTPEFVLQHYLDSTNGHAYISKGTASSADWLRQGIGSGDMSSINNLSDVVSVAAARSNLGLTTVASSGNHNDLSNIGTNTHAQIDTHIADTANPHAVTKTQVGLSNVPNTDATLRANHTGTQTASTISDFSTAADARITAQKGGKVPAAQLPSFVDDVLEYANLAAFPVTGETGKIYVDLATNKTYRWSGATYIEISASPGTTDSLTEGSVNLYFTVARVLATVLTGFVAGSNTAIAATDTILQAFQKSQGQVTAAFARANHTGTQLAATISDFASTVLSTVLTGYAVGANTVLAATDTVLQAFEKIQGQLNNKEPLVVTDLITASNTNTALTASSGTYQQVTGSVNGQRFTLPDATTLSRGDTFYIVNQTPTIIPVFDFGSSLIEIVYPYQYLECEVCDITTSAGDWFHELAFPGVNIQPVFNDDFLSTNTTTGNIGNLGWVFQGTGAAVAYQPGTNTRIGVARFSCGTANSANASMNLGTTQGFILGGGTLVYETYVSLPVLGGTGAAAFTARFGLQDTTGGADNANGIYFEYAGTAGGTINWACKTAAASTRTSIDSGVAVVAGQWYKLSFAINDAGTSVGFYIDNVLITTISTNIPTNAIAPAVRVVAGATNVAAKSTDNDYVLIYKTLLTPR
jgi:hypothetical protein